jgi:hypothetical protein
VAITAQASPGGTRLPRLDSRISPAVTVDLTGRRSTLPIPIASGFTVHSKNFSWTQRNPLEPRWVRQLNRMGIGFKSKAGGPFANEPVVAWDGFLRNSGFVTAIDLMGASSNDEILHHAQVERVHSTISPNGKPIGYKVVSADFDYPQSRIRLIVVIRY